MNNMTIEYYKRSIETIRDRKKNGLDYKSLKKELISYYPHGRFSGPKTSDIIELSGLIWVDLDCRLDVDSVKRRFSKLPEVVSIARSTSGEGIHMLVSLKNLDQTIFKQAYAAWCKVNGLYTSKEYSALTVDNRQDKLVYDSSRNQIASNAFLTVDPEMYMNTQYKPVDALEVIKLDELMSGWVDKDAIIMRSTFKADPDNIAPSNDHIQPYDGYSIRYRGFIHENLVGDRDYVNLKEPQYDLDLHRWRYVWMPERIKTDPNVRRNTTILNYIQALIWLNPGIENDRDALMLVGGDINQLFSSSKGILPTIEVEQKVLEAIERKKQGCLSFYMRGFFRRKRHWVNELKIEHLNRADRTSVRKKLSKRSFKEDRAKRNEDLVEQALIHMKAAGLKETAINIKETIKLTDPDVKISLKAIERAYGWVTGIFGDPGFWNSGKVRKPHKLGSESVSKMIEAYNRLVSNGSKITKSAVVRESGLTKPTVLKYWNDLISEVNQ